LRLALVVAAALPALGCYSTWDIPTREVAKMDGYRAPAPAKVVLARDGDEVEVDRETALHFHMRGPVPEYIVWFDSIDVRGTPATPDKPWWVSGVLRGSGVTAGLDMNQVTSLMARRYSPGKTAALVVGVVLGVAAVVGITIGVAAASLRGGLAL
jgi:hypothetical protein